MLHVLHTPAHFGSNSPPPPPRSCLLPTDSCYCPYKPQEKFSENPIYISSYSLIISPLYYGRIYPLQSAATPLLLRNDYVCIVSEEYLYPIF